MNANHITSVITSLTFKGGECRVCVVQQRHRLQVEIFCKSTPSMTYLQSSEKPVTLTTQFYHSSPIATLSHSRNQMYLKCILLKVLHYNSTWKGDEMCRKCPVVKLGGQRRGFFLILVCLTKRTGQNDHGTC